MKNIDCYIHHHLGLGDHIICNGLVRYVANKYDFKNICLVVKRSNLKNVKRMFSDLPQVTFFVVDQDREFVDHYMADPKGIPLLRVGFEKCRNADFDRSFYESVNVPFSERWDSWGLERDLEQEARIFEELGIEGDYIFVHDESSVGDYELNIDSSLQQVRPRKVECEKSIFDWVGVIEQAKEVHAMSSSFAHLIESIKLKNDLYFHDIKHSHGMGFTLNRKWSIVKYD